MAEKYQAYPEYKESGVEVIGNIPKSWVVGRLKQIVDQSRQITYGIVQAGPNMKDGIPYIRPADMTEEGGIKNYEDLLRTSPEIARDYERSKIKSGDIVCSIGPSFGKLMIVPKKLDGSNLTQGTARVAISSLNVIRYFFWVLRSPSSYQQWESSVGGATFRALNLAPLADTFVVVPTKNEQQKIADFLDHETAKIDTLIAKQQQLIALLKEKRQAVISHAVTKGLNPNAPMRDSGVEWLGEVPAHWDVVPIKYIVSIPVTDGPHETPEFIDEGVPFISAEAVSSGKINFEKIRAHISEEDNKRYSLKYTPQKYDIYMVKSGATTGVTAIVETDEKFNIWSPLAVIRCKEDSYPYFVLNFMRSLNFLEAVELNWSFGTQQNIGMGVIENLHVTRPPFQEAKLIVKMLTEKCGVFDLIIEKALSQIELMQERRTALISAAVTGKIDVRNWQAPAASLN